MDFIECSKHFIVIADKGGISKAARHLDLPISKLSKELSWLEDHLQQKLFFRTTRQLEITEAGKYFYHEISHVIAHIKEIKKNVKHEKQNTKGIIRFAMPTILRRTQIVDYLFAFLHNYSDVELKIINANAVTSILEDSADLGLSTQMINDKKLIRVTISKSIRRIFASPAYLERHGVPTSIEELEQHNCLYNSVVQQGGQWKFDESKSVKISGSYSCETVSELISAGVKGFGLIYVADSIVNNELEKNLLVQLDIPGAISHRDIYLYHKKVPRQSILAAFIDYFIARVEKEGLV